MKNQFNFFQSRRQTSKCSTITYLYFDNPPTKYDVIKLFDMSQNDYNVRCIISYQTGGKMQMCTRNSKTEFDSNRMLETIEALNELTCTVL